MKPERVQELLLPVDFTDHFELFRKIRAALQRERAPVALKTLGFSNLARELMIVPRSDIEARANKFAQDFFQRYDDDEKFALRDRRDVSDDSDAVTTRDFHLALLSIHWSQR